MYALIVSGYCRGLVRGRIALTNPGVTLRLRFINPNSCFVEGRCVKSSKAEVSRFLHTPPKTQPSGLWTCLTKRFSAQNQCLKYLGVLCGGGLVLKSKISTAYCGMKLSHKGTPATNNMQNNTKQQVPHEFRFREFLKFLWPDLWLLILASLSAIAVAMVNIQLPLLLGNLVNTVSALTTGEHVRDYFLMLREPAMKLVCLYSGQAILTFLYVSVLSCLGERLAERMRTSLFAAIIRQDIAFFDAHKTGELVNRLTADIQDFKSSFKQCISQGLRSVTQTVGCVLTLYVISPKLTGLMIVTLPVIIIGGTIFGSILRNISRLAQQQVAKATAVADEALGNVRTVRAFAMEEKETRIYSDEVAKSKTMNELLGVGIGAFQGLSNLAINGLVLVVLYCGGSLVAKQDLSPGDLMSFLVATQTIQRSLGNISILFGQTVRGLSAGARIFEYLVLKPSIPVTGGMQLQTDRIQGEVQFRDVSFYYPTRPGQVVLKHFSLDICAGTMVAVCGPSGAGKSTVAALLERFYDVESGQVLLDGHDIRELDPTWMRGNVIGFIHQEPVLFATSVMENIRYGQPDATDQEVEAVAKLANADEFIRGFPQGYNTVLGERGVTVSGGQKQRIAIARALLKNPAILILDEATSALDAESERVVQDALDQLTKGRTVIVIAHRLSTIQGADKIVVLSHGNIKESGTHQELMKRNGLYADLVRRQMQEQD